MTLCRELHKEDIEDIRKILSSTNIEHIIWRGQRFQILTTGMLLALELAKKLTTINLSTNSLGNGGMKQLSQLHDIWNNIRVLDLCMIYILKHSK